MNEWFTGAGPIRDQPDVQRLRTGLSDALAAGATGCLTKSDEQWMLTPRTTGPSRPTMPAPANPKIYHIVHVDKLATIATDGFLFSDAVMAQRPSKGTIIGMNNIKARRMNELMLASHPGLYVGQCVPFYFCPRSVMLYLIHRRNPELAYQGGQGPIIHLVADLNAVVAWAAANQRRWAFTLSNAGSYYFEDRCDLQQLGEINWNAVQTTQWSGSPTKEQKQAEFLLDRHFPWTLIEQIGVLDRTTGQQAGHVIAGVAHRPSVHIRPAWYY